MAKKNRRTKVNRNFDGIERQESTAGLMALRIFIISLMILFIIGTAGLFAYNFQKEAENPIPAGFSSSSATDRTDKYYQIFDTDVSDELLYYCNDINPINEKFEPPLAIHNYYNENIPVNALMKESLEKLVSAAADDGIRLEIVRGYMTYDECDSEFKNLVLKFQESGATVAEAQNRASALFPPAKQNEYRTGMIIKISNLGSNDFEAGQAYKWLYKNGVNYGFINRYTTEKENITKITGDLTVYRFVGTENAEKMRSFGMCLEEYSKYEKSR